MPNKTADYRLLASRQWKNRATGRPSGVLTFNMVKVIDETEADLRALIEGNLGPLPPSADFRSSLIDWLHLRARSIPQRPRTVTMSPEVQAKVKSYPAIGKIRDELSQGKDVSPWLSDSVRKKAADPKADMMFNDWQIIHFHLGNLFVGKNKVKRTDDLLFTFIAPDRAVLIDVQPHGSWAMRDLLRILLKVSPKDMTRCELKGVVGLSNARTDDQILRLRRAGMNAIIVIDGRFFMPPGLGVSSSKHSTRIVRAVQTLMRYVAKARKDLENNTVPQALLQRISQSIGTPVRLGVRIDSGQLILYDKNRNLDVMPLIAIC
jgi:hypothetical protein